MSIKNSSVTIGNRIRDLPVCSAVPQPTEPPRVTGSEEMQYNMKFRIAAQDVRLDFGFEPQR
jgi:hypothetical protein